jgi:hypothetical protein
VSTFGQNTVTGFNGGGSHDFSVTDFADYAVILAIRMK